jgi:hypothetical protein
MIIFNRWHAANYPTGHFSTDGTLQCSFSTDGTLPSTRRVISQPMALCQAPDGSFFNRWHAAKHPSANFSTDGTLPSSFLTDGTLPSTQRVIF